MACEETEMKVMATNTAGEAWQGDVTFEHGESSKKRRWRPQRYPTYLTLFCRVVSNGREECTE